MNFYLNRKRSRSDDYQSRVSTPEVSVIDRDGLKFLWEYAKPHLSKLVLAFIISIPVAALSGIIAWSVNRATQSFSEGQMQVNMFLWLGAANAFMILYSCLQVFNTYTLSSLQATIGNNIRIDLYDEIQQNSISFHINIRTGELSNLIGNDSQYAAGGVLELYSTFWQRPIVILCLAGFMLYMNPILSLLSLTFFPFLGICIIKLSRNARSIESRFIEKQGQLMGEMIESLINIRQIKAFSQESAHKLSLTQKCNELLYFFKKVVLIKSLILPTTEILSSIGIAAMAVVAYFQLQHGTTTPGEIAGCLTAAISIKRVTREFSSSVVELQRSFAAIRRISRIKGHSEQYQNLYSIKEPIKTIMFEKVSFSYDGKNNIIRSATFKIQRGERVVIIGPSGGGKTCLLDMITGFYTCTSGMIKVNNYNLADVGLVSWRNQIGVVAQEPFLFEGDILQNIIYGYPNASNDEVLHAVRRAGCLEMIERLPEGIHTQVGERGARLSGGERKRVALARALIRPISVLLLDEATSELDIAIEEKILRVIDTLAKEMIIINVSHRPATIQHSDKILFVENGIIQEITPSDADCLLSKTISADCSLEIL
jgi:ABC-type multidrug transport system fused ATPase/permease subunit